MDTPSRCGPDPRQHDPEVPEDVAPAVTRSVDLPVAPEEVWHAVADDAERSAWWGGDTCIPLVPGARGHATDPDGTRRRIEVDAVDPGRRLAYRWWTDDPDHPDGPDGAGSTVELVVLPRPGGSRLTVTETRASASAAVPERSPVRSRLLDLELLLLCRTSVRA